MSEYPNADLVSAALFSDSTLVEQISRAINDAIDKAGLSGLTAEEASALFAGFAGEAARGVKPIPFRSPPGAA
jgi:hypothetical protein